MAYKKQNWTKYGRQGEIVEIIMRDPTNAKIESFRCNDRQSYNNALRTIWEKYGEKFKPTVALNNSSECEDELKWLRKSTEW